MSILSKSVTKNDEGTWDFHCPGVQGSMCGREDTGPFSSTGWPNKSHALARGEQHFAEHKGEGVAQSLEEFRASQGIVVDDDGKVKVEDL